MLADIVKYAKPITATLIGDFLPRGGVHTKVTAHYKK
ncbi:MAG: hypothetical protein M3N41_13630 [Acidobacteriota bacterium]|nr:hypothetical protein [Acidobacteriota bacterium]